MVNPLYHIKEVGKGSAEAKARAQERKRVERERDGEIRNIVERYGVVTPAIVCARMGLSQNPQTGPERTQQRIIYRRLQRLAEHGRFRVHSEYTILAAHAKRKKSWKKRVKTGAVFYASKFLPNKENMQFEHKAMIAKFRATLDGTSLEITNYRTDSELREDKDNTSGFVYDFFFATQGKDFAVECNRNDFPTEISQRCQRWDRWREHSYLDDIRYLWITETERKARNIREQWAKDGLDGRFLVTWEDQFSPYTPSSILDPIWLWPKDDQLHSLIGD